MKQTDGAAGLSRRDLVLGASALGLAMPHVARAQEKRVRIGYQKFNTLNILKGTGKLEEALKPAGRPQGPVLQLPRPAQHPALATRAPGHHPGGILGPRPGFRRPLG